MANSFATSVRLTFSIMASMVFNRSVSSPSSVRIWNNRTKLAREIKQTMLTAIHRGSSIQQLSKALARRMEVGYNDAERLVRTELNAVENRASADAMRDAEFEYYQFVATLDRRTCVRCGEHDGEIYRLTEMHQGENAPPLHARCRCTIVATDDAPKGKRAARDANNKRSRVPADMTYTQWKARYIDGLPVEPMSGKVAPRGLAAGNINTTTTAGSPPKLIGKLESVTPAAIQKTLERYEAQIVNAPVEHAIIITKTGEIYHCSGDLNELPTIEELGDELHGAYVTHNHPVGSDNEYSFSDTDLYLFKNFKLALLRGIDEKFIYELNRNAEDVDNIVTLENATEYTFRHGQVVDFALGKGFGYRRRLR